MKKFFSEYSIFLAIIVLFGAFSYVKAQTADVITDAPVEPTPVAQELPKDATLKKAVEELMATTSLPILEATQAILDKKNNQDLITQYDHIIRLLRMIELNTRH